ncbi:hypothetical protein IFR04_014189 [Cadophora malorum]|uniref:Uncharacterized protein n=1 Tax=Cadophora malorum TaxID=108018 RepID=A0A8H7T5M0_9HELO|nr:hypothetical protein IFR04_014189 [Cadophora malorum]
MGPRQSRKSQAQASASEDEDVQQSSQEDPTAMIIAAKSIVSKNNDRRDKKRKSIEEEHEKRVKDVKLKMDNLFAARESRVTKSQQAAWARLDALDKKRQNIESLIIASMMTIETNSIHLAGELVAMFEGRLEDMEDSPSQHK